MALKTFHPGLVKDLQSFGERIRLARLRRNITMAMVSERAGISRQTLAAIESGDPGVSLGSYLSVLKTMGMSSDLNKVAEDDVLGRKLQDLSLDAPRARSSSKPR